MSRINPRLKEFFEEKSNITIMGIIWSFLWRFAALCCLIVFFIFIIYLYYDPFYGEDIYGDAGTYKDNAADLSDREDCNVQGIDIFGELTIYYNESDYDEEGYVTNDVVASDEIVNLIMEAEDDPRIKAIFLDVDSYGGYPVAGEEIADAVKKATKPVIAVIRQGALSAAYWAVSPADKIFASKSSDVGSIGITISFLDQSVKNEKDGVKYIPLRSGKYKDMLNPDKSLTDEEIELLMRDLKITHDNFINDVAVNRDLDVEEVRALADGSSMLGSMAKENGLIDEIGTILDAQDYLREVIGVKPDICW